MAVAGYKFLGWISTAEVQKDSDVWKYIYDVAGDSYVTSDPDKAEPYLATDESKVTQWQDAIPLRKVRRQLHHQPASRRF